MSAEMWKRTTPLLPRGIYWRWRWGESAEQGDEVHHMLLWLLWLLWLLSSSYITFISWNRLYAVIIVKAPDSKNAMLIDSENAKKLRGDRINGFAGEFCWMRSPIGVAWRFGGRVRLESDFSWIYLEETVFFIGMQSKEGCPCTFD